MAKDKKIDEKEVVEVVVKEVKPSASAFKCCRCGSISKISDKGNEVCAECFAPTHWKA